MIKIFRKLFSWHTRLRTMHNLVFFVLPFLCSCSNKEQTGIRIAWNNNKATGISLPKSLFADLDEETLATLLKISLLDSPDSTAILGDLRLGNTIVFEPVLPFSRGLSYSIFFRNKKIGEFSIPPAVIKDAPQLIRSYPAQDTLPENLLKIYLAFSHPMSEGQSDKYISLVKNESDTLHDVFLKLQPELWNEDRTVITVWLDPGRIKRGLQPNLRMGNPLKDGESYHLIVSHLWKDAQGLLLQNDYTRFFIAGSRDSISPDPHQWKLDVPRKNSKEALIINTGEVLDHFLLMESMHIIDREGAVVKGTFQPFNNEKNCRFIPETAWKAGEYSLVIESRLEDLAGNNLNRPFDRDITQGKTPLTRAPYERKFKVGE
ncbi:MAG: hypothetical protein ABIN89_21545 [Chitinophagaceae bacterium]